MVERSIKSGENSLLKSVTPNGFHVVVVPLPFLWGVLLCT